MIGNYNVLENVLKFRQSETRIANGDHVFAALRLNKKSLWRTSQTLFLQSFVLIAQ